tara:strand:- start:425 stop:553 length:129 start_codon:yes stop_codon:yes gene_type:complete
MGAQGSQQLADLLQLALDVPQRPALRAVVLTGPLLAVVPFLR